MKYVSANGSFVEVLRHQRLGRGGEGEVLRVGGAPDMVAKIFHHPTAERRLKTELMVANPLPQRNGHLWATWPSDLLYGGGAKRTFAGYLMPRVSKAYPLFACYNQVMRPAECPDFNYRHLVRCARNLAAALALAHSRRHVVGDLNESNVLITADARVVFLDTDSWQIVDPVRRKVYRCCVCKPDFLPAELQGRSLKTLDRQPWHDNFALAVLIFKLTNEGSHPFDGCYHGKGDPPPLGERIAAGVFPYRDRSGRWSPKPSAPPFSALHPALQQLFVQAFELGHNQPQLRPEAHVWQQALARAELEFLRCPRNPCHWAWQTPCPWCERQSLLGGLDPFPQKRASPARRSRSRQARTAACNVPSNLPALPQPTLPTPTASVCLRPMQVVILLLIAAELISLAWLLGVACTCLVAFGLLVVGIPVIAWIANQLEQNKSP